MEFSKQLQAKRDRLTKELEQLNAELNAIDTMSPAQKLAVELHGVYCNHNHTDGCSWFYEVHGCLHDWGVKSDSHMDWYKRATQALSIVSGIKREGVDASEVILKIAEAIKGYN